MGYKFGKSSVDNMRGVYPPLIGICYRALSLSPHDFGITEGLRTEERQRKLLADGKSTTMKSYHLRGAAVDFAVFIDGKITWEAAYYKTVSAAFKTAALEYGLTITWGGDWESFFDGPHIQIEG
jgi:peptidoglycan L-alanyl-D-glutamate endopeptidase CwlK